MENLILIPTEDTPEIVFNIDSGIFKISGRSLPENAVAFYNPILSRLKDFQQTSIDKIIFEFRLDYFNTASAKQITKILLALQAISETKNVFINWYYYSEDYDIKSSGARFAKLIKANIELIPYDE